MKRNKAFTLIELVVVMVLLGVAGGVTVSFLWQGTKMYVGISSRTQLAAISHNLFARLRIQIENSMPYSISVSENIYSSGSGAMLSLTIPVERYRVADIKEGQYLYLPLAENDVLCSSGLSNYRLKYLKLDHSYGVLELKNVMTPDDVSVSSSCTAGVYKVKVTSFGDDPYISGGTVMYLTDSQSDKKYYQSTQGHLFYKQGDGSAVPLNNPAEREHGAKVDIFKLNDGTYSNGQNGVTVSVKLSSGDDFITVSQRFELHSSVDF
ncbi:prepilin-type N-terminal cleavage/methylation domain-containing protein [Ruminobacter amylophilus]|jgi:prepilin-type N-terminal cleavage/methylation domain-containing protein|uniref:prepilin-type N-terminal cleavage/methylation domain-containing protein n=1 Tax=Ruminobacter amylophilus TaxID=867 RepID=UPI00386D3A34